MIYKDEHILVKKVEIYDFDKDEVTDGEFADATVEFELKHYNKTYTADFRLHLYEKRIYIEFDWKEDDNVTDEMIYTFPFEFITNKIFGQNWKMVDSAADDQAYIAIFLDQKEVVTYNYLNFLGKICRELEGYKYKASGHAPIGSNVNKSETRAKLRDSKFTALRKDIIFWGTGYGWRLHKNYKEVLKQKYRDLLYH